LTLKHLEGDAGTQTVWDTRKGTAAHQFVCSFSPYRYSFHIPGYATSSKMVWSTCPYIRSL